MQAVRIIISPAKKMSVNLDTLPPSGLPRFLPEAGELLSALQSMGYQELRSLWACNDPIAQLNFGRLSRMDLERRLTPALLSYEGIQYQYMAPGVFEKNHFPYVDEHLRILSGFYGLLKPFDGVTPYRLEMQAKLSVGGHKNLYAFWGRKLADALCAETDFILNLASKEYSKVISAFLPEKVRFITCTFGEKKGGKIIEKGTMCKMARGEMVRYLAERNAGPEDISAFDRLGYTYSAEHSAEDNIVFIKGDVIHA